MIRRAILLVLTIMVLMVSAAQAQVTQLEGRVTSQAGGPVKDAEFTAINLDTNLNLTGLTDVQGIVTLHYLPVGSYRLTVSAEGFKTTVVKGIELHVAIPARVNVMLEPGDPSQQIEVTASETQAMINTTSGELSTLVSRRQILDLPLNGRNPLELSGLQAGVVTNTMISQAAINGLRGTYNNVTQDGINIQDNFLRTEGLFGATAPSVENVLEFSIVTQNSGPETGLGAPQVRLVTPSGGNAYHGSGFYFHRNTAFNANNFFNNATGLPREVLLRHQFGGRVGGPILKNKLFFFGYYEGTREAQGTSLLRTVLTESARQGIFKYQRPDNGQPAEVNLFTFTALPVDSIMRQLILDPERTPNDFSIGDGVNTAGVRFNSNRPRRADLFGFRLDYALSRHHSLEAIFSQFDLRLPQGFQNVDPAQDIGEKFPTRLGGGHDSVRRFGALAWRANITRTLTNELRWGVQRPTFTSSNREPFASGFQLALPLVDNPIQNFLGEQRKTLAYELVDNATWLRGNHTIRFGGHLRLVRTTLRDDNGTIPSFTLGFGGGRENPLAPGEALFPGERPNDPIPILLAPAVRQRASDLLALLTGVLDSATQTFNVSSRTSGFVPGQREQRTLRQRFLSFYGGDTFRLRPNLTLNFGLRWEWHTVPTETDGLALLPVGGLNALRDPNAMIDFAGSGSNRPFFNDDLTNFAPNLSLAWDPFGDGRTSVRAGYAISYVIDNSSTAVLSALDANPGLSVARRVANRTGTISDGISRVLPIQVPPFKVPRTTLDQLALSPLNGLFTIDPHFRTPYVQQWTLSLEREILPDTALEVRYVGNRGVKLARAIDLNQPDFFSNGFLRDFLRAQFNLERTGNPSVGLPLEILPLLAERGQTVLLNPVVQEMLARGEIGEVLFFMFQNRDAVFGRSNVGIPARLGPDFFYRNFNALFTNFLGNNSFSTYHALQTEVRRRLSRGLYLQANYTFSKVLTDFSGTADNLAPMLDVHRPALERRRANFDVSHAVSGNFLYELPVGPGRRFWSVGGARGKILQGWQLSGIVNWRSGPPISIISGFGTFARRENSLSNTVVLMGLTISQLQSMTGSFRLSDGSPVLFDPRLISANGTANPEFFSNPAVGEVGTLGLTPVNGPGFFNVDLSLIKRTRITEKVEAEFHAEFFNIFNNVNWAVRRNALGDAVENINDLNFGKIVDTFDPRIVQFALKFNF